MNFNNEGIMRLTKPFLKELDMVYQTCVKRNTTVSEEDFKTIQKVLTRTEKHIKDKLIKEKTKFPENPIFAPFSLFEIFGKEYDELHYTKTLGWFLDKKNSHGFKDSLFKSLVPLFKLKNEVTDYSVETELSDQENKKNRVDIKIKGRLDNNKSFTVIIEAKINSSEGKNQLERYDKEYCGRKNCNFIFLTLDGIQGKTDNKNKWQSVSWKEIAVRLLSILKEYKGNQPEGYEALRLYTASLLKDLYNIRYYESSSYNIRCFKYIGDIDHG